MSEASAYLSSMFSFSGDGSGIELNNKFYAILAIATFFSFWGGFKRIERWQEKLFGEKQHMRAIVIMSLFSILFFVLNLSMIQVEAWKLLPHSMQLLVQCRFPS